MKPDYSWYFDQYCHSHHHYFDAVRGEVDGDPQLYETRSTYDTRYTNLETDLYQPAGYYTYERNIGVIFNSECTTNITPYASDFDGTITSVQKSITGIGYTSNVMVEDMVK